MYKKDFKGGYKRTTAGADKRQAGGRGLSTSRDSQLEKFKAKCSDCGNTCEVPFKPNGKKPVLCSLCFAQNNADEKGYDRKESKPKKDQLDAINKKLDQILELLSSKE